MPAPIRLAGLADAEEVARLMIAFRDWTSRSEPGDDSFRAGVRRLLEDPDTEYLLGGNPSAGVAQLRYRYGLWYAAPRLLARGPHVADEARGTGLGRALWRLRSSARGAAAGVRSSTGTRATAPALAPLRIPGT